MFDLQNWLSSFAIELTIAGVFTLVGYMLPRVRRKVDMRKFQAAFGANVEIADDIFFSIPLWSLQERKRSINRFRRTDPGGLVEEFYGPTNTFAREDVLGAIYVSEMMARRFKRPLRFLSDNLKIESDTWSKRSAIIIGSPMANYHARGVVRTHERFHPEDLHLHFAEIDETDRTGARLTIRDKAADETFRSSDTDDYAYVVRLNNRYGDETQGYVYLVGGIHAEGTQAAAIFLADCWRVFSHTSGPASVLLHLQRNQPETVRPIRFYNATPSSDMKVQQRSPFEAQSALSVDRPNAN